MQASFDDLSHPDPQLVVRDLSLNHQPDLDHDLYWPLVRWARRRFWPHPEE